MEAQDKTPITIAENALEQQASDVFHWASILFVSLMMVLTAFSTAFIGRNYTGVMAPARGVNVQAPPDLETLLPSQFGEWDEVVLSAAILPAESVVGEGEAVAYRAYKNKLGRVVTLVVAYGPPASDSVRLHRPETCYVAQGFTIDWRTRLTLSLDQVEIPLNRLMTQNRARFEAVSYWLRAGDYYATSAAAHQWINLQQGFGRRADGVLVRVSSMGTTDSEFNLHLTFIEDLLGAVSPQALSLLAVTPA